MISRIAFTLTVACVLVCFVISCTHEPKPVTPVADGNFPPDVANIMITRCATAGCHDQGSYVNASGLLLDTWDHLFNGDNFGAAVVPYWPQYSPLLYFVNTDSSLGPVLQPTMPYAASLTKDEYNTLSNWIAAGAPDKNGNIPFGSNTAVRQKIYALCNDNGVDLVAVIDAQKKVIMRYIKVGISDADIEAGHDIKITSDGSTAYESFYAGTTLQKMDVVNDAASGYANMGLGLWSIMLLDPNNPRLWVSSWESNGNVVAVNTGTMTTDGSHTYKSTNYPHGIAANSTFDTVFVTASNGNCIYKCTDPSNPPALISLDSATATDDPSFTSKENLGPHAIWMSPDYSKYFVTLQNTNQVRVMDAHADTLIAVIPVGLYPQEMDASSNPATPYLFVSCKQDPTYATKTTLGSVYVIDYNTYAVKKVIYGNFFQPHGVTVDNQNNLLYVFSLDADGPAQHHAVKGNKDGWYNIIDISTLAPYNYNNYELKAFPYNGAVRFK